MYLSPFLLIGEEVEEMSDGEGEPQRGSCTDDQPLRLSESVAAIPQRNSNPAVVELRQVWEVEPVRHVQHLTEVPHHPLRQLHQVPPAFGRVNYCISIGREFESSF